MQWQDKSFHELTNQELFQILKLRALVFNTEQDSTYCDPDDHDLAARHVFACDKGQVAAYARYFISGDAVTFGRVVVAKAYRGRGLGKKLVQELLDGIQAHFPGKRVVIHAQSYVTSLYAGFGFQQVGQEFMEAGRKHYQMVHPAL